MILGVDELMDMARTMVNLVGNCLATAVMARWEGELGPEIAPGTLAGTTGADRAGARRHLTARAGLRPAFFPTAEDTMIGRRLASGLPAPAFPGSARRAEDRDPGRARRLALRAAHQPALRRDLRLGRRGQANHQGRIRGGRERDRTRAALAAGVDARARTRSPTSPAGSPTSPPTAGGKPLTLGQARLRHLAGPARRRRTLTVTFDYLADTLDNAMAWAKPDFALLQRHQPVPLSRGPRASTFRRPSTVHTEPGWQRRHRHGAGREAASYRDDELSRPGRHARSSSAGSTSTARRWPASWTRLATYPAGAADRAARAPQLWDQISA